MSLFKQNSLASLVLLSKCSFSINVTANSRGTFPDAGGSAKNVIQLGSSYRKDVAEVTCGFDGNTDLYRLGIKISLYSQAFAA
jgi:hypothetical protein